jgi:hypothetical protein
MCSRCGYMCLAVLLVTQELDARTLRSFLAGRPQCIARCWADEDEMRSGEAEAVVIWGWMRFTEWSEQKEMKQGIQHRAREIGTTQAKPSGKTPDCFVRDWSPTVPPVPVNPLPLPLPLPRPRPRSLPTQRASPTLLPGLSTHSRPNPQRPSTRLPVACLSPE